MNVKEIDDVKLQEAIARFEAMHGAIEEVCSQFVGAIVEFTQEELKNEDNFTDWQGIIENDDLAKARILVNTIYEGAWVAKYQDEYDRLEDSLHPVILGDEIDVLMVEIVRAIVTQKEVPEKAGCAQKRFYLASRENLGLLSRG